MLPSLRDSDRHTLTLLALMLSCGSLVLLPLSAQSSVEPAPSEGVEASRFAPVAPQSLRFPIISVVRDPFTPDRAVLPIEAAVAAPNVDAMVLPPNAGADGFPGTAPSTSGSIPVVRAIVLGPQSRALVESTGKVQVLGVGDALAGQTIVSIDARGIVLTDGSRLTLQGDRR